MFLDAVFQLASGAIEPVIEAFRPAGQVRHEVARVGPLGGVLGFDDDASFAVPARRGVEELAEQALLVRGVLKAPSSLIEPGIARDANNVARVVALTSAQHRPAAKPAVSRKHNAHLRPPLAKPLDQQRKNRPRVLCPIHLARPEVTHQQLASTKDIQRQETVVVVVSMKEPPLPLAVYPVMPASKSSTSRRGARVMLPPSKLTSTRRPLQPGKANRFWIQFVMGKALFEFSLSNSNNQGFALFFRAISG